MRRLVLAAAMLSVLTSTATADKGEFGFVAGGGIAGTIGEISTHADYGFLGHAGIRFTPTPTYRGDIDLIFTATYATFAAKLSDRRDITVFSVGIEGRINNVLQSHANIYLISGTGIARTELSEYEEVIRLGSGIQQINPVQERTESNPYVSLGLGIQTGRDSGLQFFVQTKATNVFGTTVKNLTWFPITAGIMF